jgi:hypothetical protein
MRLRRRRGRFFRKLIPDRIHFLFLSQKLGLKTSLRL